VYEWRLNRREPQWQTGMTGDATSGKGASAPDPILLAIERHRKADAAWDSAIMAERNRPMANRDDEDEGARVAEHRAFWGLVETAPTTLEGCRALCAHLARYAQRNPQWAETRDYDDTRGRQFGPRLLGNLRDALEQIERRGY
jgi:hypothetical protein